MIPILIQDIGDIPCAVSQGGEDHRHGPYQAAGHHSGHLRPAPAHQDPGVAP